MEIRSWLKGSRFSRPSLHCILPNSSVIHLFSDLPFICSHIASAFGSKRSRLTPRRNRMAGEAVHNLKLWTPFAKYFEIFNKNISKIHLLVKLLCYSRSNRAERCHRDIRALLRTGDFAHKDCEWTVLMAVAVYNNRPKSSLNNHSPNEIWICAYASSAINLRQACPQARTRRPW